MRKNDKFVGNARRNEEDGKTWLGIKVEIVRKTKLKLEKHDTKWTEEEDVCLPPYLRDF